jgi:hypothetical protein
VRRHSTMLASSAAAALAALAVTVAAPAIGDEGSPEPDDFVACLRTHGLADAPADVAALKPWLNERLERGDATAERAIDACAPNGKGGSPPTVVVRELRACLVRHGAQIDGSDPAAVKRWVAEHADDPGARDAMKACHIDGPGVHRVERCEVNEGPPPEPGSPKEDDLAPTTEKRAIPLKIGT